MNKHLLSAIVLIGFALLAIFPASTKPTKVLSKPTGLHIKRTHVLKTLAYTPKLTNP
jgi:hypothetical protein